jgi:hypothetical protein
MTVDASAISSININSRFYRHISDDLNLLLSETPLSCQYRQSAGCLIASLQALHLRLLKVL